MFIGLMKLEIKVFGNGRLPFYDANNGHYHHFIDKPNNLRSSRLFEIAG